MSWFKKRKVKKYWIVWWQVSFSQTWIITWLMHYFTAFIEPPIDTFCIFFSSHSVLNKTILETFENEKKDHVLVIYHKFLCFQNTFNWIMRKKLPNVAPFIVAKKILKTKFLFWYWGRLFCLITLEFGFFKFWFGKIDATCWDSKKSSFFEG